MDQIGDARANPAQLAARPQPVGLRLVVLLPSWIYCCWLLSSLVHIGSKKEKKVVMHTGLQHK